MKELAHIIPQKRRIDTKEIRIVQTKPEICFYGDGVHWAISGGTKQLGCERWYLSSRRQCGAALLLCSQQSNMAVQIILGASRER